KAVGYDMKSTHRIESAIRYIIGEENQSGHSWIAFKPLLNRAIELLNIDKSLIEHVLNGNPKNIVKVDERYTTKFIYNAEQEVALKMTQMKLQGKNIFETEELDT